MNPARDQFLALQRLWEVADRHRGTSGGNASGKLLLGLYNGTRFPYDLTDLRLLDETNLRAALLVLEMDARPAMEVHELLNRIYGVTDFGLRFEVLAWEMRLKKAASKTAIAAYRESIAARQSALAAKAATA